MAAASRPPSASLIVAVCCVGAYPCVPHALALDRTRTGPSITVVPAQPGIGDARDCAEAGWTPGISRRCSCRIVALGPGVCAARRGRLNSPMASYTNRRRSPRPVPSAPHQGLVPREGLVLRRWLVPRETPGRCCRTTPTTPYRARTILRRTRREQFSSSVRYRQVSGSSSPIFGRVELRTHCGIAVPRETSQAAPVRHRQEKTDAPPGLHRRSP